MSYAGCWNMSSLTQATRWRFRNLILKLLVRSCGGSWRSPMGHRSQGLNPSQKKRCVISCSFYACSWWFVILEVQTNLWPFPTCFSLAAETRGQNEPNPRHGCWIMHVSVSPVLMNLWGCSPSFSSPVRLGSFDLRESRVWFSSSHQVSRKLWIPKHHRNHSRSQFSFNWFSLQLMSDTHVQACTSDWKHCQYVRCTMMHLYSICM